MHEPFRNVVIKRKPLLNPEASDEDLENISVIEKKSVKGKKSKITPNIKSLYSSP